MRPLLLAVSVYATAVSTAIAASTPPTTVGSAKVWRLEDAVISLPASQLTGIDPAEARQRLGGKDEASTPVNAFLVQIGGKNVLVDSGEGKVEGDDSGHLVQRLADAGFDSSQIDLVLITHFHLDHVGGLIGADGARSFPRATLAVPRAERDFWLGEPTKVPERLRGRIPRLAGILAAYEKARSLRLLDDNVEVTPVVRAVAAHGHTGGHTIYVFGPAGHELWCIGDLIHFGAVQLDHPTVGVAFDLSPAEAIAARQSFFTRAAASGAVLAATHLPTLLQLETTGSGYRARPVR